MPPSAAAGPHVSSRALAASSAAAAVLAAALCIHLRRRLRRRGGRVCLDPEVLAGVAEVRARYGLTELGFLPEACLERLTAEALQVWEDLAADLPRLNRSGGLRAAVDAVPASSGAAGAAALEGVGVEELRRAYVLFGILAHSYAHADEAAWPLIGGREVPAADHGRPLPPIPPQLAQPWFAAAKQLHMPPVLTVAATDLWNWRLRDSRLGVTLDNLDLITSATGTVTERDFHMVPCAIQAAVAEVIPKLFFGARLVRDGRDDALTQLLRELTDALVEIRRIFYQIQSGVDKDVFYDVYRPLLNGFFPDGVVLCGVSGTEVANTHILGVQVESAGEIGGPLPSCRVRSKGASEGQSAAFMLFDRFLGVEHTRQGREFQEEMLAYLPGAHRQMVLDYCDRWHSSPSVRERAVAGRHDGTRRGAALADAYDECVAALRDLRRSHLAVVSKYLSRTNTGTGGSSWSELLKLLMKDTQAAALPAARCPR